jgi:hypothetical protein
MFVALAVDSFVVDCFEFFVNRVINSHILISTNVLFVLFMVFSCIYLFLEVLLGEIDWFCCFLFPDAA